MSLDGGLGVIRQQQRKSGGSKKASSELATRQGPRSHTRGDTLPTPPATRLRGPLVGQLKPEGPLAPEPTSLLAHARALFARGQMSHSDEPTRRSPGASSGFEPEAAARGGGAARGASLGRRDRRSPHHVAPTKEPGTSRGPVTRGRSCLPRRARAAPSRPAGRLPPQRLLPPRAARPPQPSGLPTFSLRPRALACQEHSPPPPLTGLRGRGHLR